MQKLKTLIKIVVTLLLFGLAGYFGYDKYQAYFNNPWTRDGQVRAQIIQISPRVSGNIIKIHIIDN
jgi:multidrug resistance efflux pump